MARAVSVARRKKAVKCDVTSYIKILHIENSNYYYYQVIHNSFPHYPHFPHIPILNKKFTNTKQHISIKSIIVIIPNFKNMTISHKNMTISQPSIPARSTINTLFCPDLLLLNFWYIRLCSHYFLKYIFQIFQTLIILLECSVLRHFYIASYIFWQLLAVTHWFLTIWHLLSIILFSSLCTINYTFYCIILLFVNMLHNTTIHAISIVYITQWQLIN